MNMFEELQEDNLDKVLSENTKVLVQYGASWCGNCRIMKPKVKRLAAVESTVKYVYVDAEKFPNARQFAQVNNLPTFATFNKGALVNQISTSKVESLKEINHEITHI